MKIDWYAVFATVLVVILIGLFSFGITAGIIWLICKCFFITFSWRLAFGIWLIMGLASSVFKTTISK